MDAVQLGAVLVISVGEGGKLLLVGIVAGVDAHFLYNAGGQLCGIGREVDVCHQGGVVAPAAQAVFDGPQVLGLFDAGGRHPHQLAARLYHANALGYGARGVQRVRGGHALHPYGVVAPYAHGTYLHGPGGQPGGAREAVDVSDGFWAQVHGGVGKGVRRTNFRRNLCPCGNFALTWLVT